jgi:hypothetical protein
MSIRTICTDLIKEQSAPSLKKQRDAFLKLLINGVPCDIIILNMVKELCLQLKSEDKKRQIISWASFYDNR